MRYVSGMTHPNPISATPIPATPASASIYLLAAHPNWHQSRVNRQLLEVARTVPGVDVNDLYTCYPDYFVDVPTEQARLTAAQLIVLQHPIHWYSMPALQKLWLDEVLSYGWAYGAGARTSARLAFTIDAGAGPRIRRRLRWSIDSGGPR